MPRVERDAPQPCRPGCRTLPRIGREDGRKYLSGIIWIHPRFVIIPLFYNCLRMRKKSSAAYWPPVAVDFHYSKERGFHGTSLLAKVRHCFCPHKHLKNYFFGKLSTFPRKKSYPFGSILNCKGLQKIAAPDLQRKGGNHGKMSRARSVPGRIRNTVPGKRPRGRRICVHASGIRHSAHRRPRFPHPV